MAVQELLDSNGLRVAVYCVAATAALLAFLFERRLDNDARADLWPVFWALVAVMLSLMAGARIVDLGEVAADIGRGQAQSSGWYVSRRWVQAVAVAFMGTAWGVGVTIAIWRVPQRRCRYLLPAIVIALLVGFAVVRVVSLHYVDAILYRRNLGGVRIVALIETALLVAMVVSMAWHPFARWHDRPEAGHSSRHRPDVQA